MNFLETLSEYSTSQYKDRISDVCFVLPNRRAGLYLKKFISKKANKTIWSPTILSIEDFVCNITGINIAEPLTLLTELYEVYVNIEKKNIQSFDEFINWAPILIIDYSDCDMNLADAVDTFKILNEAKAISQWNLDEQPLTEHEKEYLNFYNSLSQYYPEFTKHLLKKNIAYQGLIYKKAAEGILLFQQSCTYKKIIFAGFNALTNSEEKIINSLINSGKAEIFWDSDKFYTENKIHEAGYFIRKYKQKWSLNEIRWEEENFKSSVKNIYITGVPLNIGQAEYAGQILSMMNETEIQSEKTALVLADETMLPPLLNALPDNVRDINITMGYPLAQAASYILFDAIFSMYENALKFGTHGKLRFYYKDMIRVFDHPYCRILGEHDKKNEFLQDPFKYLISANRIFFTKEDVEKLLGQSVLNLLFVHPEIIVSQIPGLFINLIDALRMAFKSAGADNFKLDTEHLFHFAKIMNRLKTLVEESDLIKELKTLHALFRNLVSSASLPFSGEPLKGLQIMGLLETRNLDFENVILLSVNENILPAGKHINTFIPFDIRMAAGLSTYKQKESIFSYHFYRLLQRAKNIHILYNSQSDKFGSGEKSRFITQLTEELPKYNKNCTIHHQILINKIKLSEKKKEIIIYKNQEILEIIKDIALNGFSPTALNSYIACPLKFYFSYVEGIEETEEVEETIDAATLGTVVHNVLKELYKKYLNAAIHENDIKEMHSRCAALCIDAFKEFYPAGDIRYGKNLLISKVVLKLIQNFLKAESAHIKSLQDNKQHLTIRNIEQKFTGILPEIKTGSGKITPRIKGSIDRIDEDGRNIRIIDYKTGTISAGQLKIESMDDLLTKPELSKSVQLLCYAFAYTDETKSDSIKAGLISLRKPGVGFIPVKNENNEELIDEDTLEKFKTTLMKLISEMLDAEISFHQTSNADNCKNCPYIKICNR